MHRIQMCMLYCEGYEQARDGFPCLKADEHYKEGYQDFNNRYTLRYKQAKFFLTNSNHWR